MATVPTARVWAGDFLTSVNMNEISSMLNFLQKGLGGCFFGIAPSVQSITSGLATAVSISPSGLVDKDGGWSALSNTRYTGHTPGWYLVAGSASWALSSGDKVTEVRLNGTTIVVSSLISTGLGIPTAPAMVYLNGSTDYVELVVSQDTGGSVNLATSGGSSQLLVFRLVGL